MDRFLRRVYLTVATALILLWIGMAAWALRANLPDLGSLVLVPSASSPSAPGGASWAPLFEVPGVAFTLCRVKEGDSFVSIAKSYGLSEACLRSLNQANDRSQPKPGSELFIPSKDGIFHVVRPGQGPSDIARAYGVSLKSVLQANRLSGEGDLKPGRVLYLPGASYLTDTDVHWLALQSLKDEKGFLKPTTGRFADGFGARINPISGKKEFHPGLDLAPGWRARVVAAQDGEVVFAGIRAGYGRLIILDHGGGLTSRYGHLDEILVKLGQRVEKGDLIGRVGMTGMATGPHLHFEIRLNGDPQNPLLYLTQ